MCRSLAVSGPGPRTALQPAPKQPAFIVRSQPGRSGENPAGPGLLLARDSRSPTYRPRRPEQALLHRIIAKNLDAFLAHTSETYEAPLPAYVEKELRAFIACGDLRCGFAVARCETC